MARLEIVDYLRSYAGGALELVDHKRADEAAAEITRLREENARLRTALKPFAAAAEDLDEDDKDNLPIWEHWAAGSVEIGHLRAAAAAIREGEKGDGKNS